MGGLTFNLGVKGGYLSGGSDECGQLQPNDVQEAILSYLY